jgi:hypothetical protein
MIFWKKRKNKNSNNKEYKDRNKKKRQSLTSTIINYLKTFNSGKKLNNKPKLNNFSNSKRKENKLKNSIETI